MATVWIAENIFDCRDRRSRRIRLCVRVGRPEEVSSDGHRHYRCPLSFEPLIDGTLAGYGPDSFSALCGALQKIRDVLKAFRAEGGRVCFRDSDALVDLDDPSFAPMWSLSMFRERANEPARAGKSAPSDRSRRRSKDTRR
jgi:hypothetical protein